MAEVKRQLALHEAIAAGKPPPEDWAGGLPGPVLSLVAEKLNAAETRGPGFTLMAITCQVWKKTLRQDAIDAAGGPEVWRDWGNLFGKGLPVRVLAKVAEKLITQNEAPWAAWLKEVRGDSEHWIQEKMDQRKRVGNCLFVFARVSKEWRKAQLKVGGPLRSRFMSDVLLPGRVELLKWALAEGCPREGPDGTFDGIDVHAMGVDGGTTMAHQAANAGKVAILQYLVEEENFPMDLVMIRKAAHYGHLEVVQWLRGNGCEWDSWVCHQATEFGHPEVLRWARENGCPWDPRTRDKAAARYGYTDNFGNLVLT